VPYIKIIKNRKVKKVCFIYFLFTFLIITFFITSGCSNTYRYYRDYEYIKNFYSINPVTSVQSDNKVESDEVKKTREKIKQIATSLLGVKSFNDGKQTFRYDCSGFVFYVYYLAGIDLYSYIVDGVSSGGVYQLYLIAQTYFSISKVSAQIGDIIIFNNTYDKNQDKKDNDLYTHTAIVVDILNDGTIVYIHKSNSGVTRGYMNLLKPDQSSSGNLTINSYLRNYGILRLSAQLFETFATFFR